MLLKWSTRIFHIIFLIMFSVITFSVIASIFNKDFLGVAAAAGFLLLETVIFYFLYKKLSDISNKAVNIIFAVMAVCMFIIQIFIARNLMSDPVTDWNIIHRIALSYAENGSMEHIYEYLPNNVGYMGRFQNNNGITVMLSFYYRILYLMLGRVPALAPVCLNTLFITVGVVFGFFIAKRVLGNFGGLVTAVLSFIFIPFYTYSPYYYTDSLSLPFVTLSLYLFIRAFECKKLAPRIILFLCMGVVSAMGYNMKGSVIITLVGALIYLIIKGGIKKFLLGTASIALAFIIFTMSFNLVADSLHMTNPDEIYKEKYPVGYWIMIGLKGDGGFDKEDNTYVVNAGNYNQKKEATEKVIKERIKNYGVGGMYNHLVRKAVFTWGDGTYWINHHIYHNIYNKNIMHDFILRDGKYYNIFFCVSAGIQIVILLMFLITSLYYTIKPKFDYTTLIRGIIFGIMIFFLVWETRSRYIFNYTPLFLIMVSQGFIIISKLIDNIKNKRLSVLKSKGN